MKLNDELSQLVESYQLPEDVIQIVQKSIALLETSGVALGLQIGEEAPNFSLPTANGDMITLESYLQKGPAILSFYRGEWCPFCNLELRALQKYLPEYNALNASLVAISPQLPPVSLTVTERHNLSFDILSDENQETIKDYKLKFTIPEELQEIYLNVFHIDLSEHNADGSWDLPVPATFIVDRDGIVKGNYVSMNYLTRMEPEDVLNVVKAITATKVV